MLKIAYFLRFLTKKLIIVDDVRFILEDDAKNNSIISCVIGIILSFIFIILVLLHYGFVVLSFLNLKKTIFTLQICTPLFGI